MRRITVALAGNPNVGKTTILNALAGTNLKVGNWSGVTVEKKEATLKFGDYTIHLVDLPGIYTLEPISADERIAVDFLKNGNVDVILNILDTTNLERNLHLTLELLEFEKPTVLVLNLYDEAKKLGIDVDTKKLSELLNVYVLKTVGRKGEGIKEIPEVIVRAYEEKKKPKLPYSPELTDFLKKVPGNTLREKIEKVLSDERLLEEFRKRFGEDFKEVLERERGALVRGILEEVLKKRADAQDELTDLLDRILLHPVLGLFIFVLVMFLLFKVAFDLSAPLVEWVDGFFSDFLAPLARSFLSSLGVPEIFVSFVSDAIVGGVGFVLSFVPLIFTLYLLITFLEMSGYVPRVAFLMDKFLHKLGLHGRSIIPLILALGCNVPAILATRTLESTREKLLVTFMIPFISCPARLVVFSFFGFIFFPNSAPLVILSLYLLGIALAVLTAFLLRKTLLKGEAKHFIIELPPYRFPSPSLILRIAWLHVKDFLYRAGTLIFGASLLVWALLNLPPSAQSPKESYAGRIGQALVPVFKPMGIEDWRATTAIIPAFLAREILISSMGVLYSSTEEKKEEEFSPEEALLSQIERLKDALKRAFLSLFSLRIQTLETEQEGEGIAGAIRESFSPASALAFMVFILVYTSCLGTVATMWREVGGLKALAFLLYSFLLGWLLGTLTYSLLSSFFL